MWRYLNYSTCSRLPLNYEFASDFRSFSDYNSRWYYSYVTGKEEEDVDHLQEIILLDGQATIEDSPVGHLQSGVFIGPVLTPASQKAIDTSQTENEPNLVELPTGDFIDPVNIGYYCQRRKTFQFCELIHEKFPHPITWAAASNTTRSLWENWWTDCESLINSIQRLPFHEEQVAVVRELDLKLNETFGFFERRKQLEASEAQVTSKTRSGKRC
jgi:hypothetical protein